MSGPKAMCFSHYHTLRHTNPALFYSVTQQRRMARDAKLLGLAFFGHSNLGAMP